MTSVCVYNRLRVNGALGTVSGTLSQIWLLAKKGSLERKTRDIMDKQVVFDQDYGKVSYHPSFPSPQECLWDQDQPS